jgi:uncharacterized protein YggE
MKRTALMSLLALVVCACATTHGNQPPQASVDHGAPCASDSGGIVVQGSGHVSAAPDRAVIVLGAIAQGPSAAEAQRMVNEVLGRAIDHVRALGVPDQSIRTAGISVEPVFAPAPQPRTDGEPPQIVAYRASNHVRVEVDDLARLGPVIDAVIASGGNQVESLSFEVRDEKPRLEALRQAVVDAHEKAQAIASALKVELGEPLEISELGPVAIPQPMARGAAEMAAPPAPTPVQPGQLEIQQQVTIRFRLR